MIIHIDSLNINDHLLDWCPQCLLDSLKEMFYSIIDVNIEIPFVQIFIHERVVVQVLQFYTQGWVLCQALFNEIH